MYKRERTVPKYTKEDVVDMIAPFLEIIKEWEMVSDDYKDFLKGSYKRGISLGIMIGTTLTFIIGSVFLFFL